MVIQLFTERETKFLISLFLSPYASIPNKPSKDAGTIRTISKKSFGYTNDHNYGEKFLHSMIETGVLQFHSRDKKTGRIQYWANKDRIWQLLWEELKDTTGIGWFLIFEDADTDTQITKFDHKYNIEELKYLFQKKFGEEVNQRRN